MVGEVRSRDQRDPTAAAAPKRKRTRTSASEQGSRHSTLILDGPNAAEEALVHAALEELSQSHQKGQADRAVAQRKADEKARVAAEQAQTLRKDLAVQAETDLCGAKTQALRAILEQVAEARAAGMVVYGMFTQRQVTKCICICICIKIHTTCNSFLVYMYLAWNESSRKVHSYCPYFTCSMLQASSCKQTENTSTLANVGCSSYQSQAYALDMSTHVVPYSCLLLQKAERPQAVFLAFTQPKLRLARLSQTTQCAFVAGDGNSVQKPSA